MLSDPILERIGQAESFFFLYKDGLLQDQNISFLLSELRAAIRDSHCAMAERGIVELCKDCEEKEGGSCCGAGLEDHYHETLLLINLLLGVGIPKEREDPAGCFFLSNTGCRLLARHVICINYLCKKISDRFDPHELAPLREKEGIEVELLFRLNEDVKKHINDRRKHQRNPSAGSPFL